MIRLCCVQEPARDAKSNPPKSGRGVSKENKVALGTRRPADMLAVNLDWNGILNSTVNLPPAPAQAPVAPAASSSASASSSAQPLLTLNTGATVPIPWLIDVLQLSPLELYRFVSKRPDLRENDWPDLTPAQQEEADALRVVVEEFRTAFRLPHSAVKLHV